MGKGEKPDPVWPSGFSESGSPFAAAILVAGMNDYKSQCYGNRTLRLGSAHSCHVTKCGLRGSIRCQPCFPLEQ
jgi:hypothetical protein